MLYYRHYCSAWVLRLALKLVQTTSTLSFCLAANSSPGGNILRFITLPGSTQRNREKSPSLKLSQGVQTTVSVNVSDFSNTRQRPEGHVTRCSSRVSMYTRSKGPQGEREHSASNFSCHLWIRLDSVFFFLPYKTLQDPISDTSSRRQHSAA